MIVVAGFVVCAIIGWTRATKRGGTTPDKVQYALAHGIPGALAALALTVILERML